MRLTWRLIELFGLLILTKEGYSRVWEDDQKEMMWQTGFGRGMLKRDLVWRSGAVRSNRYIMQNTKTGKTMIQCCEKEHNINILIVVLICSPSNNHFKQFHAGTEAYSCVMNKTTIFCPKWCFHFLTLRILSCPLFSYCFLPDCLSSGSSSTLLR